MLLLRGRNAKRAVVPENIFDKSERLTASCPYSNQGPMKWIYLRYISLYLLIFSSYITQLLRDETGPRFPHLINREICKTM